MTSTSIINTKHFPIFYPNIWLKNKLKIQKNALFSSFIQFGNPISPPDMINEFYQTTSFPVLSSFNLVHTTKN